MVNKINRNLIRLLIVDDILFVRDALAHAIGAEPDLSIVATATSPDQALAALEKNKCDLALISSSLNEGGAITLMEAMKTSHPEVNIIVLGIADTKAIIVRYIEAGAIGYLLRNEPLVVLLEKIRAAFEERAMVTPEIAALLIERVSALASQLTDLGIDHADYDKLTTREKEILGLVADGLTNQEIADELVIEIGTVKNHVHNILEKLNVHSRQDAAIYLSLMEHDETLPS